MKTIAVIPGNSNSVHLVDLLRPSLDDISDGRGVLVKVLRVGVDSTDREINAAEYGAAPAGYDFLVIGHESFGQVEAVGPNVTELCPDDYVVATVRRPGASIYDRIGTYDMTTDDTYYERGIDLRHGYLTEYDVDDPEYIVKVPQGLKDVAVLLEPHTVVEKGIAHAYEIHRRLRVWRPRRAAVMGAGTVGLLATLVLRLRGLEITTFALSRKLYSALSRKLTSLPTSSKPSARVTSRRPMCPYSRALSVLGRLTSSSRPPASRPSSLRACKRYARTACWCSPASPAATAPSRSQPTRSIWNLCSAIR